MKLAPGPLPSIPSGTTMDRLPIPLSFSPDLLWRYPLGLSSLQSLQLPNSPLFDYKSQLPNSLASDPRSWSREDVVTFLRWSEREFDLQPLDVDMFQINGKAMCLLTRNDLSERAPGSGDVLHNVLQLLVREANLIQRCLPTSPVTPTTRQPYPFSPHATHSSPTPNWNADYSSSASHAANLAAQLIAAQSNSVTLSPAPSVDSQAESPQQVEIVHGGGGASSSSCYNSNNNNNQMMASNQSDSDEDSYMIECKSNNNNNRQSCNSPNGGAFTLPTSIQQQDSGGAIYATPRSPREPPSSPSSFKFVKREFFPNDSPESNTNGRLLWDFLQQLLNDPSQRYTNYIAWKDMPNGVFKIVDPAGLAKLWGIQKNHLSMNYDKMSRALRYYYRVNILRKVQGERHCYQFLRNPTELKNIKNLTLLRQQISPTKCNVVVQSNQQQQQQQIISQLTIVKNEPTENDHEQQQQQFLTSLDIDEKPTDLSINTSQTATDLRLGGNSNNNSNSNNNVNNNGGISSNNSNSSSSSSSISSRKSSSDCNDVVSNHRIKIVSSPDHISNQLQEHSSY